MVSKLIVLTALMYWIGSLVDNMTTWVFVVELGLANEMNPYNLFVHKRWPLWTWFARDTLFFVAYWPLVVWLGGWIKRKGLESGRPATVRIGELSWLLLVAAALARLAPAVHNVLFLFNEGLIMFRPGGVT